MRRLAATVSTLGLLVSITGAGTGVAREGADLSTLEGAKAYLVSQGYDPSEFVFQVGVNNYAGVTCPGLDWNCTAAALVVQITTPGGMNHAECGDGVRRCIIFQGGQLGGPTLLSAGDMNMHAHCGDPDADEKKRMMLKESGVLVCEITQLNPTTGNNFAVVGMSIHDNDDAEQDGTEDATVTQTTNGDGDNHAVVHEEIVLSTRDEPAQMQDGFQYLDLTQETEAGDNFANVKQTQKLTAHARDDATTQKQNTLEVADPCVGPLAAANTCIRFEQTTESGRNDLNVHQDHNVKAVGAGGQQNQGCMTKECTLEVDGSQQLFGSTNSVDNHQSVTYTLRGPEGTTQIQDPRIANGPGSQVGGSNDLWKVTQLATLRANDPDVQAHINQVDDFSTGTVDARSVIVLNNERSEIECTGQSCFYVQACGTVEEENCAPSVVIPPGGID
ncbi:MAG TPA: hypothetical protein VE644_08725 [Gaiellaceae bacterium]|nr:hypothetical protein [Gaiellaceae bacterium]